ncbi:MAG: hypothetical protein LBS03_04505 [Bacteroidales bacterium]|jgi:hypothetical protein|nr:hypothetical protein [Bacteroidales bacterium]
MAVFYKKLMFAAAVMLAEMAPTAAQSDESADDESAVSLLTHTDTVKNPVYMPVIGLGTGYFAFHGELKDAYRSLTVGKPGVRVNVASYIGQTHRLRANLVFLTGNVYGTQRTLPKGQGGDGIWNLSDTVNNLNFKSTIYSFGFNLHYSFQPLIKGKYLTPFVSVGLETMSFNSKADCYDKNGLRYHYWSDGTIRTVNELTGDPNNASLTQRDYTYETDWRTFNKNQNGLKNYSNFSFALPIDIGFDINVSDRVTVRTATSLHYTFTDLFDGITPAAKKTEYQGKKGNDLFTFSYISLHLDLFSQDKIKVVEELFANADDFDMAMYDDEDNDGIFDGWDECPGTPANVPVDSLGCPFDKDGDGVPDYLDRQVSRTGAVVDEFGVEVTDATIVELLGQSALGRKDVEAYLSRSQARTRARGSLPIPAKFKSIDKNNDGYISFDEMLKTIDAYFDGTSGFSHADIRELNGFFFDQ